MLPTIISPLTVPNWLREKPRGAIIFSIQMETALKAPLRAAIQSPGSGLVNVYQLAWQLKWLAPWPQQ